MFAACISIFWDFTLLPYPTPLYDIKYPKLFVKKLNVYFLRNSIAFLTLILLKSEVKCPWILEFKQTQKKTSLFSEVQRLHNWTKSPNDPYINFGTPKLRFKDFLSFYTTNLFCKCLTSVDEWIKYCSNNNRKIILPFP